MRRTIIFISLLTAAIVPGWASAQTDDDIRIHIPVIDVDAPVVDVHVRQFANGDVTWDVSGITQEVGYFTGTAPLHQGNTVYGGHSELAARQPGVFYRLHEVEVGDEIFVIVNGDAHRYVVAETYYVPETDIAPIMPTLDNRLTLITCDRNSYTAGTYTDRFVVVAFPA